MKRLEIISKLMEEGFSSNTLVKMTDKQITLLSDRILSEQTAPVSGAGAKGKVYVKKAELNTINQLTKAGTDVIATEGELQEEPDSNYVDPISSAKSSAKNEYSSGGQALLDAIEYVGGKSEWDALNPEEQANIIDEMMHGFDTSLGESKKEIKTWLTDLVKENYHAFTTKKEITEMINKKLKKEEKNDEEQIETKKCEAGDAKTEECKAGSSKRKKEKLILGQQAECDKK
jgi:hypothetical protein